MGVIKEILETEIKRLKNENFKLNQKINKLEKEKELLKLETNILEEIDNLKLEPLPPEFLKELQDFFNSGKTTPTIINYKEG
ncbi:hypothetical protein M0P65_05895 [Candidatus Gracilibacteria bacterium]|jgi:acyl-CoA thioesterase FadM|nr:hypothetical protein [Candidatus Gracilibacteria bacterium]